LFSALHSSAISEAGFTAHPGYFWSGISYQIGETGNWQSIAKPNDEPLFSNYFFGIGLRG